MAGAGGSDPLEGPGVVNAFRAWQAAVGGQSCDWHFRAGLTDRPAIPLPCDLLFPGESPAEKALADWLTAAVPHLVQPIRMLRPAPRARGLRRLFGGGRSGAGEILDASDKLVSGMLAAPEGTFQVAKATLTDVTRLTVALARDAVRLGGQVAPGGGSDTDEDRAVTGLYAVLARPWPEMAGLHELPTVAGPLSLIPMPNDLMLAHVPKGGEVISGRDLEGLLAAILTRRATLRTLAAGDVGATACLRDLLPHAEGLSGSAGPLHDGGMDGGYGLFANRVAATWAHLDAAYIRTLISRHGASVPEMLDGVHRDADLGEDLGGGLFGREVDWMMRHEWAQDAATVLHQRGPFAFLGTDPERLRRWMAQNG
ncbi:MAG: hypothetical protein P1U49_10175 [Minwuia sp.]|nr:hypothetical protein [Minwuia sp.]